MRPSVAIDADEQRQRQHRRQVCSASSVKTKHDVLRRTTAPLAAWPSVRITRLVMHDGEDHHQRRRRSCAPAPCGRSNRITSLDYLQSTQVPTMDFQTLALPEAGVAGIDADALIVVAAGDRRPARVRQRRRRRAGRCAQGRRPANARPAARCTCRAWPALKAGRVVLAVARDSSAKAFKAAVASALSHRQVGPGEARGRGRRRIAPRRTPRRWRSPSATPPISTRQHQAERRRRRRRWPRCRYVVPQGRRGHRQDGPGRRRRHRRRA